MKIEQSSNIAEKIEDHLVRSQMEIARLEKKICFLIEKKGFSESDLASCRGDLYFLKQHIKR